MEHYEKTAYAGLLIQGKLREAVAYLSRFPGKEPLVKRYHSIFENGKTLKRSENDVINRIDAAYQTYYREVFWQQVSREEAAAHLYSRLAEMFGIETVITPENAEEAFKAAEQAAADAAVAEAYYFLGGMTAGYLGPYIWKSTEPIVYDVILPHGNYKLIVNMMDGFVSRSWLDFLSFGKIGTGGWSGLNGELYCVRKSYASEISKPSFTISYLMHEAQHAQDMQAYPGISPMHLEYRAKLVELISYPRLTKLRGFLCETSDDDETNTHAYASFLVVRNLSCRVFGSGYEGDFTRWHGKLRIVQRCARELLNEYPRGV